MTTLSFDKFFDLQSFLMMVVLLLLLYECLFGCTVGKSFKMTNLLILDRYKFGSILSKVLVLKCLQILGKFIGMIP
jgi:hypothetical protein